LFDLKKNKRELLEINKRRGWGSKGKECGRKEKEEERTRSFLSMIISGNVYIFLSISKLKYCLIFILFEYTVHP
jgi:hypothetical protein